MSTITKESGRSPEEFFAGFASWSDSWVNGMHDAEKRLKQLQHVADELNDAFYRTSLGQMEDMFSTFTRMSELLSQAREPGALISVQPDMLKCVMDATQSSNRRFLALADELRHRGIEMVGSEESTPRKNGAVRQQDATPAADPAGETTQGAGTA
ncbi:MAG: hypothetical protein JJU06_09310 [Ectothiorhodospiraceae bacterium]|nr:hypothetical protein [Ectothiorhodospiraceae bacterium]MCH8504375.1 hypothetical protein [Ectothiorhodospiraceae bacterium]